MCILVQAHLLVFFYNSTELQVHVPWGVVAAVEEKVVAGAAHVLLLCKDLRIVTIAFEGRMHALLAQKLAKAAQSLAFTNGTSAESTFAFR